MARDTARRHRANLRLKGFDYSQPGAYFITICTHDRQCLFGQVQNGEMRRNEAGQMVCEQWQNLPARFPTVVLDAFVVMPNHVHGIIVLGDATWPDATGHPTVTVASSTPHSRASTVVAPTIGEIVGAFKSITTVLYARGVKQSQWPAFRGRLWQRNYYEHVIRSEESWERIREYIAQNPLSWHRDRENADRTADDEDWERLFKQ